MRRLRLFVPLVATLSLLSACVSEDDSPKLKPVPVDETSASATTDPAALRSFYAQKLKWHDCRGEDRCTRLTVPLDYEDPAGRTIELSVLKVPTRNEEQRIGSLVVNPGGPGASGVDYAAGGSSYFGDELLQAFDVVGFDPRGVGESAPVECVSDDALDLLTASDPDPDSVGEVQRGDQLVTELFAGCLSHDAALTRHMSTVEAAKDIDILRAALGEGKLVYFGASYGTFLGATYADLFAQRVGRMVLDGAIDPSMSTVEMSRVQAGGFETALRAYVADCVGKGDCFLGDSVDAGVERIQRFLADLDGMPIRGAGGRELTEGLAVLGIWAPLYDRGYWRILTQALESGLGGSGAQLVALADVYTSRGPDGYTDNGLEALYVVNCLDHDDGVPTSEATKHLSEFESTSPTFGRMFASGLSACTNWPVHTGRGATQLDAKGSAPILVVGTTRDPATPLAWAEGLTSQLDNAVLVKRDGDGHLGYHKGNDCVDAAVERYLVSGTVSRSGVTC